MVLRNVLGPLLLKLLLLQLPRLKIIDEGFDDGFVDVASNLVTHIESTIRRYVENDQLIFRKSSDLTQLASYATVWPREKAHCHCFDVSTSSSVVLIGDALNCLTSSSGSSEHNDTLLLVQWTRVFINVIERLW